MGEMPILSLSAHVVCYSAGIRGLQTSTNNKSAHWIPPFPFQSLSSLQCIMTELVTIFPLTHESPHKALKEHLKSNQKIQLCTICQLSLKGFIFLGLED